MYCCWLVFCTVDGSLLLVGCVNCRLAVSIVVGGPCVLQLVGREYCCWLADCIVVGSMCVMLLVGCVCSCCCLLV